MQSPTDGYSHDMPPPVHQVDFLTLTFLRRFPVLWLRNATSSAGKASFEEAEAGKRELANLIDIKVGQLKFATAKELKMHFHVSKAGRMEKTKDGSSLNVSRQMTGPPYMFILLNH